VQAGTAVVTLPSEEELYHQFFFFFFSILLERMSPVVTTLSGKMTPPYDTGQQHLGQPPWQQLSDYQQGYMQQHLGQPPWQQQSVYQQGYMQQQPASRQ
jgi:hypothetical protein